MTTKLWRNKPVEQLLPEEKSGENQYIFPSGRQSLSQSLIKAGLTRGSRVAIPEWSSQCVINAVARFCTPVPMTEIIGHKIKVQAIVIYEQWGWPISWEVIQKIQEKFSSAEIIMDQVDSAHFKLKEEIAYQLTSFSKLLGVSGGGLLAHQGNLLSFRSNPADAQLLSKLEATSLVSDEPYNTVKHMIKNNLAALDKYTLEWIKQNDLFAAIEQERQARQRNLKEIVESGLADRWPAWMTEAVVSGAGPGIVPILKGESKDKLTKAGEQLLSRHGVETAIYHFNWSGNPLKPEYQKCLALPVHGQVQGLPEILEEIHD